MFPAHVHDLGPDFWEWFLTKNFSPRDVSVLESRPSIVSTSMRRQTLRTLAARMLKAPRRLLGKKYAFVGGWEVFVRKESDTLLEIIEGEARL
jgi:hypothetical protein